MDTFLRFWIMTILLTFPAPLLMGKGYIHGDVLLIFLGLTLVLPFLFMSITNLRSRLPFPAHRGVFCYVWLFWSIFFGTGTFPIHYSPTQPGFWALHIAVLVMYQLVILVSTVVLTEWVHRARIMHSGWSQTVTMSLFAFPIPLVFLGNLFYMPLEPAVAFMAFQAILQVVYLAVLAMIAFTMASIVGVLMPKWTASGKFLRFLRMFVTAGIWLVLNGWILFGDLGQGFSAIGKTLMPLFSGSIMVYISPLIFEMLTLLASTYIGIGVERLGLRLIKVPDSAFSEDPWLAEKNEENTKKK